MNIVAALDKSNIPKQNVTFGDLIGAFKFNTVSVDIFK